MFEFRDRPHLWLSGSGNSGIGDRVPWRAFNRFPSQTSDPVFLEAGESYFFEVLHKESVGHDHVSIEWEGPGIDRELVPASAIRSYYTNPDDLDDDYLPDSWESRFGLDPGDNGLGDRTRQGERGDYDGDGLTNHREYLLGSNPSEADTDGDGIGDRDEVEVYGADPTFADASPPRLVADIDLSRYSTATSRWAAGVDGGLGSVDQRGNVGFTFSLDEPGIHKVELDCHAIGTGDAPAPVTVRINGVFLGDGEAKPGHPATGMSWLTPWLEEGDHTVTVESHNVRSDVSLVIDSLEMFALDGTDDDANGVPDWMEGVLRSENNLVGKAANSMTSPVCLEGTARYIEDVGVARGDSSFEVRQGVAGEWFANVPLDQEDATSVSVEFEGGAFTEEVMIEWDETNLHEFADQSLTIREGDALRLTAWSTPENRASSDFEISFEDGRTIGGSSSTAVAHRFTEPGTTTLSVTLKGDGVTEPDFTVDVEVVEADLGPRFDVPSNDVREWTPPSLSGSARLEGDAGMLIEELDPTADGRRSFDVGFSVNRSARGCVVARLPDGGPVLDSVVFEGFFFASATWTGEHRQVRTLSDGTRVYSVGYVIDGAIPPDLSIWLSMQVAGVTFASGDSWYELTADDFNDAGEARLEFLKSPGSEGSYICHWISQFEGSVPSEDQ